MLSAMTQIILVRHGETEWNVSEVFRGRCDIGLNEAGVRQAELLADHLIDPKIEAVYSSPLKRALDTAKYMAKRHGLDVTVADGLVDFNYGVWQGLTHQEVKERYRALYEQWLEKPHLAAIPEGESLDEVRKRALGVVDGVISKYSGTVVLVSHRVVTKVLICSMLGLDTSHFWNIKQDVGAITTFDYDGDRFILIRHNDTSHLRQMQRHTLIDF